MEKGTHAIEIEGYLRTQDLVERIGLGSKYPILRHIKDGLLVTYHLGAHEGKKNPPHYIPAKEAEEYIEKYWTPQREQEAH